MVQEETFGSVWWLCADQAFWNYPSNNEHNHKQNWATRRSGRWKVTSWRIWARSKFLHVSLWRGLWIWWRQIRYGLLYTELSHSGLQTHWRQNSLFFQTGSSNDPRFMALTGWLLHHQHHLHIASCNQHSRCRPTIHHHHRCRYQ